MALHKMLQYLSPIVLIYLSITYFPEQLFWAFASSTMAFISFSFMREKYRGSLWILPYFAGALTVSLLYYLDSEFMQHLFSYISLAFLSFFAVAIDQSWNTREIYFGRNVKISEIRGIQKKMLKEIESSPVTYESLIPLIQEFNSYGRESLERDGFLISPPRKGKGIIPSSRRSRKGEELLRRAKCLLFALLYGDEDSNVHLARVENELLSITLPRKKAYALLPFMRAVTEIGGRGTWIDPRGRSHDVTTDNVILEVVYGEIASEMVGNGIKSCLLLINDLEINEKVLFFRMMNIEQTNLSE